MLKKSSSKEKHLKKAKKKKRTRIIFGTAAVLIIFLIIGLNIYANRKTACLNGQIEIYQNYKDAVVLVKNTYILEISINDGAPFQLDLGEDNPLEHNEAGTGFFVSRTGKIITNHHIVEPWLYQADIQTMMDSVKRHVAAILPNSINEGNYKTFLEKHWNEDYDKSFFDESAKKTNANKIAKNISLNNIKIIPKSTDISVALHGSKNDWLKCNTYKIADGDGVDIAVLQLQSKTLPASVINIVDLETAFVNDDKIQPGTNAILIGYPLAFDLADSPYGIKVQMYEGQINKESDGTAIQYNATSTHGASGSPVFNECGQLIAINYAGYDAPQGYNFGIVAKHVLALVK